MDTDLIFLRPVEHLWNQFDNFNQQQVRRIEVNQVRRLKEVRRFKEFIG